jgi:OmpA-OmpF porin, OOP family
MKKNILILLLLGAQISFAQDSTMNKSSLEVYYGRTNAAKPLSHGNFQNKLGSWSLTLGYRYSFNNKFGMRLSGSYMNAKSGKTSSTDFSTDFLSGSLEGVFNMGRILNLQSSKLNFMVHTGFGGTNMRLHEPQVFSVLKFNPSDKTLHYVVGITPTFKISEKLLLSVDYSYYSFSSVNYSLDWEPNKISGFAASIGNISVGLTFRLGKNASHIDDYNTDNKVDLTPLENRVNEVENGLKDDDNDGVPNKFDEEKDTPENTPVDAKGKTIEPTKIAIDSDHDGITDEFDKCPNEKGLFSNDGCPAKANDENGPGTTMSESGAKSTLFFELNSTKLTAASATELDKLAESLKGKKVSTIVLNGHSDQVGSNNYNMNLSKQRANSIKSYLSSKGIKAKYTVKGFGETELLSKEETEEANAKNRRVEIVITF